MLAVAVALILSACGGEEWKLVWSQEFDEDGLLDETVWNYEQGFKRNHEHQWYQPDNARCENGVLVIEARRDTTGRTNPMYREGNDDWRNRPQIEYTSSSVNTREKFSFLFGRLEVRAKIPTASGAWPAIWLLGDGVDWPSCGEIDVMEYYRVNGEPHILANACWGNDTPWEAIWNSQKIPFTHFTEQDPDWADKFHIWRMDWAEDAIKIYLDDELLNDIRLSETYNGSIGHGENPFHKPQYLLLNLALGGDNGGPIDNDALPMRYEVDYVRVYQRK